MNTMAPPDATRPAAAFAAAKGEPAPAPLGPWRRAFRRLIERKLALVGFILVAVFLLFALLVPIFALDPLEQDFSAVLQPPSLAHPFGTDDLGRDVLARAAEGARVSLFAGIGSTALAFIVGVPIGLFVGYYRGWSDAVAMRLAEVIMSFPFLVFAVGLAAIFGASLANVIIALAIAQLPGVIRIARGEAVMLREQDFIAGAIVDGAGDARIVARYIFPNAMNPLIVQATVMIPAAIIGEATLNFLGLGVRPPGASLGIMLTNAQPYLSEAPYLALIPGLMIVAITLGFNLLGDGLRDILDPRSSR